MNKDPRRPVRTVAQLAAEIAQITAADDADPEASRRVVDFVKAYFAHEDSSKILTRPPLQIARALQHHARLARRRPPGQSMIELFTPSMAGDGWEAGGHTVLTVVADDKPWIIDTISVALAGQGWTMRELIHPMLRILRDQEGNMLPRSTSSDGEPLTESWVWIELYPPLGASAEEAGPRLTTAVRAGLADLDVAAADAVAMHDRLLEVAGQAGLAGHPDSPVTAETLRWLADDRFVLLGAREFDMLDDRSRCVPRPDGLGILRDDQRAGRAFCARPEPDELLTVTKDSERSRVRRSAPMDYLAVHLTEPDGAQVERRFLGLFTSAAITESVQRVPVLRNKARQISDAIGYRPDSYGGRAVSAAIEAHPREELFQASVAELIPVITDIADLDDPRRVLSYLRRGRYGRFLTALILLPRDRYNTVIRQRIERLLLEATGAASLQWSVQVGDSPMARFYVVLQMPEGQRLPELDSDQLRQAIEELSRTWDDRFFEIADRMDSSQRGVELPDSYKEAYTPVESINDLVALNQVSDASDMAQIMYVPSPPENGVDFRLKILRVGSEMVLSQVLPHLASLGVDVVDERPFELELRGQQANVYDFGLRLPGGPERLNGWSYEARARFTSALAASYVGLGEADGLNRLVTDTRLSWQQVSVLRAISRYLRQLGTTYSQPYIAATLDKHRGITVDLMALFDTKFNPWLEPETDREAAVTEIGERVLAGIAKVSALDEDRMLRQYLAVINAMVRTNFFALDRGLLPSGAPNPDRGALAFKLEPGRLDFAQGRQPLHEIFVYSPQVEGVHLRFARIARGGLRWSDRAEDYRTEVLGLVSAQTVKNSIIVPGGAKGGFYPLRLAGLDQASRAAEARASYSTFIRALLSVTDNIVDHTTVHPPNMVVWDGDDPYLVVAADKGTASFSDLANQLAAESGFWLGDAFASGGSHGYDHKAMGITARGAWVSAQRHFSEMGLDPEQDEFTCVGIGDMSGDVFGNGLLMSRHTRLVAAFNHRHIFLDPNPDPQASYVERERLFQLSGSGWDDYRADLISTGGGVHLRTAKAIPVSDEVRDVLGLASSVVELTPNEMIQAILRAPVDLIWNGGIGTYVKASPEASQTVGDRGNDAVRVDANQVRARCVVEGGNLGWTQAARVEYALAGGRINTDFIDNSAGVSTSDREVNIKILLNAEVAAGRLSLAERDELLVAMTDELAAAVLAQNLAQNRALANSLYDAPANIGVHEDLINSLESEGVLDRVLDGLPASDETTARADRGQGLVGPELSTLLATVKISLAHELLAGDLPDDPYLADRLVQYFPTQLRERFADRMPSHPLAREIITTVAVNRFVDSQGISAAHRLREETGASAADVVRGQLAARNLMDAGWLETTTAKSGLAGPVQTMLRVQIRRVVERATRWLLQEYRGGIDIEALVALLKPGVRELVGRLPELSTEQGRLRYNERLAELREHQVPDPLAEQIARLQESHLALPIVRVALQHQRPVDMTARVYFDLSERLGVDKALRASRTLPRSGRWEIMARASVRDELINAQAAVASAALALDPDGLLDAPALVEAWWDAHPDAAAQHNLLDGLSAPDTDLARMSVAVGSLRALLTH